MISTCSIGLYVYPWFICVDLEYTCILYEKIDLILFKTLILNIILNIEKTTNDFTIVSTCLFQISIHRKQKNFAFEPILDYNSNVKYCKTYFINRIQNSYSFD